MAKRNVGLEIALSLGAAVVFGVGLWLYIDHSIERPTPIAMTPQSPGAAQAERNADDVRALATQWAQALANREYGRAHSLMAPSFRDRVNADAFRALVMEDAQLAGIEDVAIFRTKEQRAASDANATLMTLSATGMLKSRAGTVEITMHFVREGDQLRILTVLLAGVPALTIAP